MDNILNEVAILNVRLLGAAEMGKVDVIKDLISQGANLQQTRDVSGRNVLHRVAMGGDVACCKFLITALVSASKESLSVNDRDHCGCTPLHLVGIDGHHLLVKVFVEAGADIDATDNVGKTPLMYASSHGHVDVSKELLNLGAILSVRDNFGIGALHTAAVEGHNAVCKLLIDNGFWVNSTTEKGDTPLALAIVKGRSDCARFLLDSGADINILYSHRNTILHICCKTDDVFSVNLLIGRKKSLISTVNDHGETPLHVACSSQSVNVVYALLESGADPNKIDSLGRKPVDYAEENPDILHAFGY